MGSNYKMKYNVDIVFVIDATGSMGDLIDIVKKNALNLHKDIETMMGQKGKIIQDLRIKIITFRDYLADGDNAMLKTDFFNLPEDTEIFNETISSITAFGGGDDPEDGLEALAYAIRSKWNTEGLKKRQLIVVWSDAPAHELGFGKSADNYPKKMAKDFNELTQWWGDKDNKGYMDYNSKRLILFTPDLPWWNEIRNSWDNVIHYMSEAGKGLEEVNYKQIIDAIAYSI